MSAILEDEMFLRKHIEAMSHDLERIANGDEKLCLPFASAEYLRHLTEEADLVFQSEPTLLRLDGPVVIVGDLHGHILDLYRIIQNYDLPPNTSYLFLGDLCDRGEFSIETLSFVYVLKVLFPQNVFLIRGNHEFRSTTIDGGLLTETEKLYPRSDIFETFVKSFEYIPLAALINNVVLCLHGGLSPGFTSVTQLDQISRPITNFNDPLVCGILWSDPSEKVDGFIPSQRGTGFLYGQGAVTSFLKENRLKVLIRGHECVKEGITSKFDKKVYTVFSASNYCGVTNNKAAVCVVDQESNLFTQYFSPFQYLKRKNVVYPSRDESNTSTLRKTVHPFITPLHSSTKKKKGSLTVTINTQRYVDIMDRVVNKPTVMLNNTSEKLKKITRKRNVERCKKYHSVLSFVPPEKVQSPV